MIKYCKLTLAGVELAPYGWQNTVPNNIYRILYIHSGIGGYFLDNKKIPENIDYDKIHNLASEAKQKLKQIRPTSIGQALRISGVNPADISLLMVYIKKEYFYEQR